MPLNYESILRVAIEIESIAASLKFGNNEERGELTAEKKSLLREKAQVLAILLEEESAETQALETEICIDDEPENVEFPQQDIEEFVDEQPQSVEFKAENQYNDDKTAESVNEIIEENTLPEPEECIDFEKDVEIANVCEPEVSETIEETPVYETIATEPVENNFAESVSIDFSNENTVSETLENEIADSAIFEEKEDADINPAHEPVIEPVCAEKPKQQVSVDEKLTIKIHNDIRKAFTLNDKFLYRRELFGNSTAQYEEALNLISEMQTYDEAKAYFLDNFMWDENDENVKSFLLKIAAHFGK